MVALIQRVSKAQVRVDGRIISSIKEGMLVLLGIRKGDTKDQAMKLAERCV
ncbi:MAG: D-aminoacyl-tRNA deacylase, partial [candidate division WOR-3 bacterium]